MPVKKGKGGRIRRILKAREPQLVEGAKRLLLVRGPSTSEIATSAAKDLVQLKKPDVKVLSRKNEIRPFEDVSSLEFLCEKNECAAFVYVSHNKKRPHNLVLGRMYDSHIYDMVELGITSYEGLGEHEGPKKALGASPCIVFSGEDWDTSPDHKLIRQLLLDVFGARDMTAVSLQGMDHVLLAASTPGNAISIRGYSLGFKASGERTPRVELLPMGPDLDLAIRRVQHPSAPLEKEAMRIPAALKVKKVKNVTHDALGETIGRVHMTRQDFDKLELKKTKAHKLLRKRGAAEMADADGSAAAGGDDDEDGDEAAPAAAAAPAGGAGRGGGGGGRSKRARKAADEDDE